MTCPSWPGTAYGPVSCAPDRVSNHMRNEYPTSVALSFLMTERCVVVDVDRSARAARFAIGALVRPDVVGVPRLERCRRPGTRARRAPRSRAPRTPTSGSFASIPMPATTLRPSSQKFGDSPQVHRVDARARPPADQPDLLGRHRRVDRPDHLGVAVPALDARSDHVRSDRDELRLERRALRAERL